MLHDKFITLLLFVLLSSLTVTQSQTKKPIEEEIKTLLNQEQTEKAKDKIDSIKKLPYFKKNDTLQTELYRLTSRYYRHKNKIDSAIKYREKAWAILQNDNFDKHFIDYLPTLAYYHWEAGSYSDALELIQEAKRNINKTDSINHSRVYNILGLTYLELRNFEKAEENFFNAIELAKKYSNERYLGVIYANTGRLFFRQGKYKNALQYYNKGTSLEMKNDDYKAAGRSYADIGNIYIHLENYEKARTKLDTALKFNKRSNDQLGYCRTYLALGRLSQKQEKYNDAEEYFLKVIKYAKEKTAKKELMEGYYGIHQTYKQKEEYKESLTYLNDYLELYKDLYSIKKIIEVENLQHKLNLQKEQNENQQEQLKKQKTINRLMIAVIILVGITSFTLLILLIRSRKNRKALRAKNQEIQKQKSNLEQMNLQLKQAKEQAENSEALKNQFLRNISHEIRTPLNGIVGFSSILAQSDITKEEKKQYHEIIEQNAKTLLATIGDIIDIAKIKTQQIYVLKEEFDINALLQEIKKLFQFEAVNQNKSDINIFTEPGSDNKQIIYTDEGKLRKILLVLCNNALKFTKEGYIKFGYKTENSHILFFVEDSGIGISKENQKLIFESFSQVEKGLSRNYNGIGVGLTIAKAFVEILNGKLWFESEINQGTKFYFRIPMEKQPSKPGRA